MTINRFRMANSHLNPYFVAFCDIVIKNPGPKDPALGCPLMGFNGFFPVAAVCWSDGARPF